MKKHFLALCLLVLAGTNAFGQVAPEPTYPSGGIDTNGSALSPGMSYCGSNLSYSVPAGANATTDIIAIFENYDGSGLLLAENDNYTLDQSLLIPAGNGGSLTLLAVNKASLYNTLGLLANPLLCGNFVPDPDPLTTNNEACEALGVYYSSITGAGDITVDDLLTILASLGGAGVPATTAELVALLNAVEAGSSGLLVLDFSDTSLSIYVSQILNAGVMASACNDNGTPADPSDDTFTFSTSASVLAPASLGAASYSITGDYAATSLAYGVSNTSTPQLISNGDLMINIVDSNSPCSTALSVTAPVSCSGGTDCDGELPGIQTPGSTCDDGMASTINDMYNASCVCAGTDAVNINLSDPCSCANPANIVDGAGAITLFAETITINGPAGTVYTLSAQTGMTNAAGVAIPTGGTATANAAGVATFSFFHAGAPAGYTATFTSIYGPEAISGGGCSLALCNAGGAIPTASEWGLMILAMSLMSIMVIYVRQRKTVLA